MIVMEELLTLEEAAKILRLKEDTLTRRIREGKFPYFFKVGGNYRITPTDLRRLIQELKEKK